MIRQFEMPQNYGRSETQAVWHRESGSVTHPFLGVNGIRVVGRQPLCKILGDGSTVGLMLSTGIANVDDGVHDGTPGSGNYVEISPLEMGGRLKHYAYIFQKFVFRKIRYILVPGVATTASGNYAFCVTPDPGLGTQSGPPNNFDEVRMVDGSCCVNRWVPGCSIEYRYRGMDTWFCGFNTSDYMSGTTLLDDLWYRSTSQGVFCAYSDIALIASIQGYIDVEYEVEFYYNTYDVNAPIPPPALLADAKGPEKEKTEDAPKNSRGNAKHRVSGKIMDRFRRLKAGRQMKIPDEESVARPAPAPSVERRASATPESYVRTWE
jgi:hypothetical protein